jgi:hypothetical protein
MKIVMNVVAEGDKGILPFEVLLINGGREEKVAELREIGDRATLDIEHPEAIVVRPLQA